ncbi:hypothetical protein K438DRAFT_1751349 [Mycena galopus ATCC 62051]|nr:hypothetical protein K438DRAFT_1751349 [Mycena galopus ATCC 62051]
MAIATVPHAQTNYRTHFAVRNNSPVHADPPNTPVLLSANPSTAPAGESLVDLGEPKSRSVTPELLYSKVVTASSVTPSQESDAFHASLLSNGGEHMEQSSLPALTANVDYGLLEGDLSAVGPPWTEVTKKIATTHREHPASRGSATSDATSPVTQATTSLTAEQLRNMALRFSHLADQAEGRTSVDFTPACL